MVRTRHGAIAAADAFLRIDANEVEFVFMHGPRRTHMNAFGSLAMIARQGDVVRVRIRMDEPARIDLARSALVIDHTPVRSPQRKVSIVSARHHAGAATRTARIVEIKPASQSLPFLCHRAIVCVKYAKANAKRNNTSEHPKAPRARRHRALITAGRDYSNAATPVTSFSLATKPVVSPGSFAAGQALISKLGTVSEGSARGAMPATASG